MSNIKAQTAKNAAHDREGVRAEDNKIVGLCGYGIKQCMHVLF